MGRQRRCDEICCKLERFFDVGRVADFKIRRPHIAQKFSGILKREEDDAGDICACQGVIPDRILLLDVVHIVFVFDDQAVASGERIRPGLDDTVEVPIHIQDIRHTFQSAVFRSVVGQNLTCLFFLIDSQDGAGTCVTDLSDFDDDIIDRLLEVRGSMELDTGVQYSVRDFVIDFLRHLLSVRLLRDFLRIGAVVDVSFVMERK